MTAPPTLIPVQKTSPYVLPATGTTSNVVSTAVPYGIYLDSSEFVSGAASQVSYTYKMLGGDVLDIELTEQNIYTSYELAVLEYSYIVNNHQAVNVLSEFLGATTGTFDHKGGLESGELSPYNALQYRNLLVRTLNNELLTNHTKQFGYYSDTQKDWR